MADILIRDVPDSVVERVRLRAVASGRTVDEFVRAALENGAASRARLTVAECKALVDRNMAQFASEQPAMSADERREGLM